MADETAPSRAQVIKDEAAIIADAEKARTGKSDGNLPDGRTPEKWEVQGEARAEIARIAKEDPAALKAAMAALESSADVKDKADLAQINFATGKDRNVDSYKGVTVTEDAPYKLDKPVIIDAEARDADKAAIIAAAEKARTGKADGNLPDGRTPEKWEVQDEARAEIARIAKSDPEALKEALATLRKSNDPKAQGEAEQIRGAMGDKEVPRMKGLELAPEAAAAPVKDSEPKQPIILTDKQIAQDFINIDKTLEQIVRGGDKSKEAELAREVKNDPEAARIYQKGLEDALNAKDAPSDKIREMQAAARLIADDLKKFGVEQSGVPEKVAAPVHVVPKEIEQSANLQK